MADTVVRGGSVLDGTGREPRPADVVVRDGTIVGVVEPGQAPTHPEHTLDATGLTVLPGLIDAHAHPGLPDPAPGANDVSTAEVAALLLQQCSDMLDAGFTTARFPGGVDGGLVRTIERGLARGPRIRTAGPVLCQCGGHGDYSPTFSAGASPPAMWQPGLVVFARVCDGEDDVRRAVRHAFRQGASFIKMCVTGGGVSISDHLEDTQFTVPEIRAAVEEAAARRTYVTVHAHNNEGIRNALDAGALGIEHGTWLSEENAARMAAMGAVLVPTLSVLEQVANRATTSGAPVQQDRIDEVRKGMHEAIAVARAAGVTVGAGSDLVGAEQRNRGLEVALRSSVTDPMEALCAMTSVNARVIRMPSVVSLEVGKHADLLLVEGDPLADLRRLAVPRLVMQGGLVVA